MSETPLDRIDEQNQAILTTNPLRKAAIYLVVMFFGEFVLKYISLVVIANMVLKNLFSYLLVSVLMSFGTIFGIIIFVELFRYFWYKRKQRISNGQLPDKDPLWFQIIESAFALWILSAIVVIGMAIYTYS